MSQSAGVSLPTVRQAYLELERQRRVESWARSGFYMRRVAETPLVRPTALGRSQPAALSSRPLMERVFDGIDHPGLVPLGIANPCLAKPAAKALHRTMKRVMARLEDRSLSYSATLGEPALRRQIAYNYLDTLGARVDSDDVCITNGGQEALLLALQAVASPGDVVAVESPTYHGLLELIDSLGMLALEVETCPEQGVDLDALRQTLARHDVTACIFATTLANPLGVSMPEENRRALAALLDQEEVVLIEDDVYGELRFDGARPVPARFLHPGERIITCGSFSKTAGLPHRLGGQRCLPPPDRPTEALPVVLFRPAATADPGRLPGFRRLRPPPEVTALGAAPERRTHERSDRGAVPEGHPDLEASRQFGSLVGSARRRRYGKAVR
jgi:DNA-binding transcriptional MocR family regulator